MSRSLGYRHSEETKLRISLSNTGELSSQWKGNNAGYTAIHGWLVLNFGRADRCDNIESCNGKSGFYDWALIKGFGHGHFRARYWRLCRSCHKKYDMTDEIKLKISEGVKRFRKL